MSRILIIEDDRTINQLLSTILTENNYKTTSVFTGIEARTLLSSTTASYKAFDLILLDLMLPVISGEDLLTEFASKLNIPIIIISAKGLPFLKAQLLRLGADDYITKPFDNDEVLARIECVLRRTLPQSSSEPSILSFKDITINVEASSAYVGNSLLSLTSKEYAILVILLSNPTKVFSKANLFESIWEEEYAYDDNTINVHMSNLRQKLRKLSPTTDYIETLWGLGYRLVAQ